MRAYADGMRRGNQRSNDRQCHDSRDQRDAAASEPRRPDARRTSVHDCVRRVH
jgi:hypothetical protein